MNKIDHFKSFPIVPYMYKLYTIIEEDRIREKSELWVKNWRQCFREEFYLDNYGITHLFACDYHALIVVLLYLINNFKGNKIQKNSKEADRLTNTINLLIDSMTVCNQHAEEVICSMVYISNAIDKLDKIGAAKLIWELISFLFSYPSEYRETFRDWVEYLYSSPSAEYLKNEHMMRNLMKLTKFLPLTEQDRRLSNEMIKTNNEMIKTNIEKQSLQRKFLIL